MEADNGRDLGWWDIVHREAHPATRDDELLLLVGVRLWERDERAGSAAARPTPLSASPPPIAVPRHPPLGQSPLGYPPPVAEPARDLAANRPGQQLAGQIAAAHAAGQRPTLWRTLMLGKNASSTWERGAVGERLVAAELDKLATRDRGWVYLNSIPVGSNDADIDHLLIGPPGVFTINSKNHQDASVWVGGNTYMVNGQRQPYVRNSRHEAQRASRLLTAALGAPIGVTGLIVPVGARSFTVREQPDDVHVVNRRRLNSFLRAQPRRLTPQQADAIYARARLSTTWATTKSPR